MENEERKLLLEVNGMLYSYFDHIIPLEDSNLRITVKAGKCDDIAVLPKEWPKVIPFNAKKVLT